MLSPPVAVQCSDCGYVFDASARLGAEDVVKGAAALRRVGQASDALRLLTKNGLSSPDARATLETLRLRDQKSALLAMVSGIVLIGAAVWLAVLTYGVTSVWGSVVGIGPRTWIAFGLLIGGAVQVYRGVRLQRASRPSEFY